MEYGPGCVALALNSLSVVVAADCDRRSCEDARLSRVFSWPAFDPLKQAFRPSPPALGQLGNRKQPLDLIAIAQVDAKYIADGDVVIGPLDNSDPILGADIALDDDS